jgi:lipoprotein-anchoring transpeptidase ErfK/SrfK
MSVHRVALRFLLVIAGILAGLQFSSAQIRRPPAPAPSQPARAPSQPLRKATDLIRKQDPISINQQLLAKVSPDDMHIIVSIPKQRAYLMTGEQVVIDSPISSGKRGHSSPTGKFTVLEKDKSHHSTLYGDFRDSHGRIVRAGVSARIDAAPSGTHFVGAEMKWFMRLTGDGVGMHVGILPGYPASHGCIRMPSQAAELFYAHVKVGTPAEVQPP